MALISRWNIVRLSCIAMQIGLSRVPWDDDSSVEDRKDAILIQFVDMEPLSRNSIRATQKQDPVLSLVVKRLKPGIRPSRGGGKQTAVVLVTVVKDGLVFRRWKRSDRLSDVSSKLLARESLVHKFYVLCPTIL